MLNLLIVDISTGILANTENGKTEYRNKRITDLSLKHERYDNLLKGSMKFFCCIVSCSCLNS